jgi:hypothetical protein
MTSADDQDHSRWFERKLGWRRRSVPAVWTVAGATLLCVAVLAAGCGGSDKPGLAGSGPNGGEGTSGNSSGGVMAKAVAYARCMRSHGVPDFPDPTANPGGGFAFEINGGPESDLNRDSPAFSAADHDCRALLPGGDEPAPVSAPKLTAEVKWARCMRSHGLPGFPDPNAQGAFDSSRFDDRSPAFQAADQACHSLEPSGPMTAVPGHGSAS